MNEDELVANLFRINQTKQKLIRDNIKGEKGNYRYWWNYARKNDNAEEKFKRI